MTTLTISNSTPSPHLFVFLTQTLLVGNSLANGLLRGDLVLGGVRGYQVRQWGGVREVVVQYEGVADAHLPLALLFITQCT